VDASLTGICNLGTDSPQEGPYTFPDCGAGRGKCVPLELIPEDRRAALPPDTCGAGKLCAPSEAITNPNYKFPSCTASATILACNCPGACIPQYVADFQAPNLLAQDNCARTDDRCAPCNDPTNGTPTGACN
jgi:hypothetical protein